METVDNILPIVALFPIYITLSFTITGLLVTIKAAPIMLGLKHAEHDTAEMKLAFDGFRRWGNIRAIFQILTFVLNIRSIVAFLA